MQIRIVLRSNAIGLVLSLLAIAGCSRDGGHILVTAEPPATTVGATDTTGAEAEIRQAFATFANVNATQDERDAAVEDGEVASAQREARLQQYRSEAAQVSFIVDDIRFVSPTEAAVDFRLRYGIAPSPLVPDTVHGTAVLQGGHWRVSKTTTCMLAKARGMACLD